MNHIDPQHLDNTPGSRSSRWAVLLSFLWSFIAIPAAQSQSTSSYDETGHFFSQSFAPEDYEAHPQNWVIFKASSGLMYIGNTDGVLEYDGVTWTLIPITNQTPIRSLGEDDQGRIYVGAIGELGFLAPDSVGSMQYHSMVDQILPEDRVFSNVWGIQKTREGVYFQSNEILLRLNDQGIRTWRPKTRYKKKIFMLRDTLYVQLQGSGLMQMVNDVLVPAPGAATFADKLIVGLSAKGSSGYVAVTESNGIFSCHPGGEVDASCTKVNSRLEALSLSPYHSTMLHDSTLVVGTRRGGVVFFDQAGRLLRIWNQDSGLRNNGVWHTYKDPEDNLWLGLNDGIVHVNTSTPISYFDNTLNLTQPPSNFTRHHGELYVSTIEGVYKLTAGEHGELSRFVPISNDYVGMLLPAVNQQRIAGRMRQGRL